MAVKRAAKLPLTIGIAASALVVGIFYASVQLNLASETAKVERVKNTLASALVSRAELRIQDEARALEFAAKLPQMQSTEFANQISQESKGIPADADPQKRAVLKSIGSEFPDFETVSFLMANGDVYSVEPSELQKNLPTVNFAYRDYFVKTTETQKTYVSEIFRSRATNHNTVVISTPVFQGNQMVGMLVGAMNLDVVSKALQTLEFDKNEVAVFVDSKDLEIASSDASERSQVTARSYSYLGEPLSLAFSGNSGTSTVMVNGTAMHVTFSSVDLPGNRWALLLIQPAEDAFSEAYLNQRNAMIVAAIVIAVMGATEYILFRAMHRNMQLSDKLEAVNEELKIANKDLDLKAQQLRRVDMAKEEFAAMITHELKTPLVPIIGFSELLADGTLGELTPLQKEKVNLMHSGAVSLSNLITDLLDVRKLELNKMKFDFEKISARDFVASAVESIKPLAESKKVSLTHRIEAEPDGKLDLVCDVRRIRQVLYNLLSNAIKFVPEKTGKVAVIARMLSDGSVEFSVMDNGIGIPKEKQDQIFKKFYQVDTSLRREAGGTGLGLAISKGIVEAHGGRIWFESVPGQGTVFYFSIPANPVLVEKGGNGK